MSTGDTVGVAAESGLEQEAASAGLFVRRSSGLVRDIGLRGAFGINLGVLSVGGALGYFVIVLTLFPGVNLTWMLIVGGLLTGLLAYVYSQLSVSLARDGGDYIYQARIFHPIVGAWVGIALLITLWYTLGTAGSFYVENFLTFTFQTLGEALHISFLTTVASELSTKPGILIGGLAVFLISIAFCLAGAKISGRVAYWFVIVGLVGAGLIIIELFAHSGSSFQRAFDSHSGGTHAYSAVLAQAHAHGWKPGTTMSATISAIPYGFLAFGSFWFAAYEGGEVKRPANTQKLASLLAIGFGIVFVTLGWLAMRTSASLNFIQAAAYLQTNAPQAYAHITSVGLSPQQYAVMVAGDPVTKVIIAVGFLAWMFPGTIGIILAVSRILFALSFDRLVPAWAASVSGRRRQPIASLVLTGIVGMSLYALVVYDTGVVGAFRNLLTASALIAFMACLAAIALPYRRRDLYEASPKVLPGKWLGIERVVWVSAAAGIFCALVSVLTITKGQYSGGFTTLSIVTLLVIGLIGPIIYLISRLVRGSQGIDVSLAMRELPPE